MKKKKGKGKGKLKMNLYAYILNGIPLNEISHWTINQLGGNAPFIASPTLPSGDYVDVSSIENWKTFGRRTNKDYKFIRNEIKLLANSIGWNNLTSSEKRICAKHFIVGKSRLDEIFTIKEQIKRGFLFHGRSTKTRDQRWSHAEIEIFNRLGKNGWRKIFDDINQDNLTSRYINEGLEGTIEGDAEGLFDYLDARSGTSYATDVKGFRNKNLTPRGIADMSALADLILDIVKNGNY